MIYVSKKVAFRIPIKNGLTLLSKDLLLRKIRKF